MVCERRKKEMVIRRVVINSFCHLGDVFGDGGEGVVVVGFDNLGGFEYFGSIGEEKDERRGFLGKRNSNFFFERREGFIFLEFELETFAKMGSKGKDSRKRLRNNLFLFFVTHRV